MSNLPDRPILLASGSPRRAFLLREAAIPFRQVSLGIHETYPEDMHPPEVPEYLASHKASHYRDIREKDEIILAADSVVLLDGNILGKPADRDEAVRSLERLSGRRHEVITGVCLEDLERSIVFSDRTEVEFCVLNDFEIAYYVDRYRPYDKAGAYGIQEWIGWCRIREIRGSYSNIMGLPIQVVYDQLARFTKR